MFFTGYFSMNSILPKNTPFHLNKVFMSLQMVGFMLIFSFFMSQQYLYLFFSIFFTIGITYMIRNQTFITESQFLSGMIEHHQMALLMAQKIRDQPISPITRALANNIISSQQKEIEQMKAQLL